jgi:peptidylprolyl isomerase
MNGMSVSRSLAVIALALTSLTAVACGGAAPENTPPPAAAPPSRPPGIPPPPDVAAPPANATKTASGIAWIIVKPGTGTIHPKPTSTVKVHYTGWKTNGEMFDSSIMRGEPIEFSLDGVIKGWTEGVQLMVLGEKRRFWIPGPLAYDLIPDPTAPKGMLVFDIELLDIK